MERGNEQSKKVNKVLYQWQKMLVCRASSRLMTRTRVEINVLSSYLSAEKLSIPRANEYEKEGFFFRRLKKNIKVEEDTQWRFPRVTSARKPFVYRELCRYEESKKRDKERVARYAPSCVNFFEDRYLWKI